MSAVLVPHIEGRIQVIRGLRVIIDVESGHQAKHGQIST